MHKLTDARDVWNCLNGLVCVYKSAGETAHRVRASFLHKLSSELNELNTRPPQTYVSIDGDTSKTMKVTVRPSFADDPLVVGPRYQTQDFVCGMPHLLGFNTSGIFVLGLNYGSKKAYAIKSSLPLRSYRVQGFFGQATDNMFKNGNVISDGRFKHVRKGGIERFLAAVEASHQRLAYESCGAHPESQEAYELAVRGLVRPADTNTPIVYSAKLVEFNPPHFTIELTCVNEYEAYLVAIIRNMGSQLHSPTTCSGIQCTRHSFFSLENALLKKHWTLTDVIANIAENNRILKRNGRLSQQIQTVKEN